MDSDTVNEITADTQFPDPAPSTPSLGSRVRAAAPGIARAVLGVPMQSGSTGNGGGFTPRSAITGNQASNPDPSYSDFGKNVKAILES